MHAIIIIISGTQEPSSKWVGNARNYSSDSKKWAVKMSLFNKGQAKKWVGKTNKHFIGSNKTEKTFSL